MHVLTWFAVVQSIVIGGTTLCDDLRMSIAKNNAGLSCNYEEEQVHMYCKVSWMYYEIINFSLYASTVDYSLGELNNSKAYGVLVV